VHENEDGKSRQEGLQMENRTLTFCCRSCMLGLFVCDLGVCVVKSSLDLILERLDSKPTLGGLGLSSLGQMSFLNGEGAESGDKVIS
jgi:hypothetical protein